MEQEAAGLDRWVASRFINAIEKKKKKEMVVAAKQGAPPRPRGRRRVRDRRFGAWARCTDGAGSSGGRGWGRVREARP